jgi:hypothetical protein
LYIKKDTAAEEIPTLHRLLTHTPATQHICWLKIITNTVTLQRESLQSCGDGWSLDKFSYEIESDLKMRFVPKPMTAITAPKTLTLLSQLFNSRMS